jgi:hypothetical protein
MIRGFLVASFLNDFLFIFFIHETLKSLNSSATFQIKIFKDPYQINQIHIYSSSSMNIPLNYEIEISFRKRPHIT